MTCCDASHERDSGQLPLQSPAKGNELHSLRRHRGPAREIESLEAEGPQPSSRHFPQQRRRFGHRCQTSSSRLGDARDDMHSGRGSHDGCAHGGKASGPEHHYVAGTLSPAPQLDPHRSDATLRVGTAHHGQRRCEAVTSSRRHTSGHSVHSRKGRGQQEGIRQRGAIAVPACHRIGKPAELPPRTARTPSPAPVAPVDSETTERLVMLVGARRATRAHLGDMYFVHPIELGRAETGQQAGEARHVPGADNQPNSRGAGQ